MQRRQFIRSSATLAAAGGAYPHFAKAHTPASEQDPARGIPLNQQSVSRWCYGYLELPTLLSKLKDMGLGAIDLIAPAEYDVVSDHGMQVSMAYGREGEDITRGWIYTDDHDALYEAYSKAIPDIAKRGWSNLVCFAGNRQGRFDLDGLRIAARGIKRVVPILEEHGVTMQMELFNSKVDHPDYMADSSAWAIALVDMVGSDAFKLLYDIYHMQIQEGNVIQTILDYGPDYFGHYHTAGVPGRHELTEDQELNYPAVMRAIRKTGFSGYVAHEFVPTYEEKLDGLREAVRVCS